MSACQNGSGAKKGRKKLYECQVGHLSTLDMLCTNKNIYLVTFFRRLSFCISTRPHLYFCLALQVCSSVFNSWDQFKDHLVTHTGEKPNHCTICDQWFTQPRDLQTHLLDYHGLQQKVIVTEEVMITDPTTVLSMTEVEEGYSEDGMRVEHVTVEPMDVVAVEETLVVEDDTTTLQPSMGGVEETVVLQVEDVRLKEQPVEIHIEQVTVTETEVQQDAMDSLKENVEIANV